MQESKVRGAAPGFGEVRAALQSREGIAETCRWRGRVALLQQLFLHAQHAAKRYDGTPFSYALSHPLRFPEFQVFSFPGPHPSLRISVTTRRPRRVDHDDDPARDVSRSAPPGAPEGGRHRRTATAPTRVPLGSRRACRAGCCTAAKWG